jgi:cell division protease FtsH
VLGQEERRRVAYHEMGHALVAATLPGVDPVHKVSIIPRGVGALGYIQRPTEDRFLLARHDLENRVSVLMGGRAAEALIFDGEVSDRRIGRPAAGNGDRHRNGDTLRHE